MAVEWIEDFGYGGTSDSMEDRYPSNLFHATTAAVTPGKFVGYAFGRGGGEQIADSWWRTPSLGMRRRRWVGQWVRIDDPAPAGAYLLAFVAGGVEQLRLDVALEAGGDWSLRVMRGTFELAASRVIPRNEWVFVEFFAAIHPTVGEYELQLDGIQELVAEDVNTADAGVPDFDAVEWAVDNNTPPSVWQFAHIYVVNDVTPGITGFLGPVVTTHLPPELIGARDELARSAGTDSVALVDEPVVADGDATYLRAQVNGAAVLLRPRRLRHITRPIVAVAAVLDARLETTDTFRRLTTLWRQGGVEVQGPSFELSSTAYGTSVRVLEENPLTSRPWTLGDLAGADRVEAGVEATD